MRGEVSFNYQLQNPSFVTSTDFPNLMRQHQGGSGLPGRKTKPPKIDGIQSCLKVASAGVQLGCNIEWGGIRLKGEARPRIPYQNYLGVRAEVSGTAARPSPSKLSTHPENAWATSFSSIF